MLHRDVIILQKIIREIDYATARVSNMDLETFLIDDDAQHGVGMAAINVGELIKHISNELREGHPEVPWKQAAGLRDVAAHTYDTIRMDDLFMTVTEDFKELKTLLERIKEEE